MKIVKIFWCMFNILPQHLDEQVLFCVRSTCNAWLCNDMLFFCHTVCFSRIGCNVSGLWQWIYENCSCQGMYQL